MEREASLTVTVLKTGPLVAELLTRDLTSVDGLGLSIRPSPVLESTGLRVVETSNPSGSLGSLQGVQLR